MSQWYRELTQRLTWASRILINHTDRSVIRLDNGVSLDLSTNRIILDGDFALHVTGNLNLSADGEATVNGNRFDKKQ